jgi:hypothetical protein
MSSRLSRAVRVILPAAVACLISGCTKESQDGDTTIFTYAAWVPGVVLGGGILGTVVGVLIRKSIERLGWALIIGGPVATFLFAPGLYADKVTISNERFTMRTGFWFAPTVHEVQLGEVSHIELTSEKRVGRRGTTTNYYMQCHRRAGNMERVPINDLMKNGPLDKVLHVVNGRGIQIVDRR